MSLTSALEAVALAHQMFLLLLQSNAEPLEEIAMFLSSALEPQTPALQMASNQPQLLADLEIQHKHNVILLSTVMVPPTTVLHNSFHPMALLAMTTQTARLPVTARMDFALEWTLDAMEFVETTQLLPVNSVMMAIQFQEIAVQVYASLKLPAFNADLPQEDAILLNIALEQLDNALQMSMQDALSVQMIVTTALEEDFVLQTTTASVLEDS